MTPTELHRMRTQVGRTRMAALDEMLSTEFGNEYSSLAETLADPLAEQPGDALEQAGPHRLTAGRARRPPGPGSGGSRPLLHRRPHARPDRRDLGSYREPRLPAAIQGPPGCPGSARCPDGSVTARTLKTITREADAMHMRTTVGRFSPPRSRGDGGFTLIELMVTMVIAGLLFALAVGGYRAYSATQAHRGTAEALVVLMREAQQRAVTEGVAYGVRPHRRHRALGALEEPERQLHRQARHPATRWAARCRAAAAYRSRRSHVSPSFCVYFRPRGTATAGSRPDAVDKRTTATRLLQFRRLVEGPTRSKSRG